MISLESPTIARLQGNSWDKDDLKSRLTYTDERARYGLLRYRKGLANLMKSSSFLRAKMGDLAFDHKVKEFEANIADLKTKVKNCLLFEDERGIYTYSGLAHQLYDGHPRRDYDLPGCDVIPWANVPKHKDRPYQVEAVERLLLATGGGPAGIELPTGAGKSTIIRNLLKEIALGAVVQAPSKSIAGQLVKDLAYHFGSRYVGLFGDGKKQFDKKFVVAIDDSLAKVERGSEAWAALSSKPVFVVDESHLTPAHTLQAVCFGLMAAAPYRFFVSATQIRNDGLKLVLDAITGRIVYRKTLRELVDAGYLARLKFKVARIKSKSKSAAQDPKVMTQNHLWYDEKVCQFVGRLAKQFVEKQKRPTIILVEEVEQFRNLLPFLPEGSKFAHGPLTKDNKTFVPEAYRDDDPTKLVDAFNRGEVPVLVGTSCISTGTDIQVAEAGIYLRGMKSEISVTQGVGRLTRGGRLGMVFNPWTGKQKLEAVLVDVDVVNGGVVHDHAEERASIYDALLGPVQWIDA